MMRFFVLPLQHGLTLWFQLCHVCQIIFVQTGIEKKILLFQCDHLKKAHRRDG